MKRINLVYEEDFADVDILCVPDNIADDIENVTQKFCTWLYRNPHLHKYKTKDLTGHMTISLDTDGFIWWLNNYYITSGEKATVIEMHGYYRPDYPTASF